LKFSIGVGIGERMSGNDFGENWKFKMVARDSFATYVGHKWKFHHIIWVIFYKWTVNFLGPNPSNLP
jgi:hypothetical protein